MGKYWHQGSQGISNLVCGYAGGARYHQHHAGKTLLAFSDHGEITKTLSLDGADSEAVSVQFRKVGIDLDLLASDLQTQGSKTFSESWQKLLGAIEAKGKVYRFLDHKAKYNNH